jgi:hypothetical protein
MNEFEQRGTGSLRDRCETEIVGLHRFFVRWYRGELDATGEDFARVSDVLTEDFRMVNPDGVVVARSELLTGLRRNHGSRSESFDIRIENVSYRPVGRSAAAVTYEEWQTEGGRARGRVSTAIFREHSSTPNGVEWLHVHETWLPD